MSSRSTSRRPSFAPGSFFQSTGRGSCCVTATLWLLVTSWSSWALAAGEHFVPGKDDRPAGRPQDYQRQVFPCDDPRQTLLLEPGLTYIFDDTTSAASTIDAYACQPGWPETGPEHIYALNPTQDMILDAYLAGNVPDHDLVLLAACHTDSCLVQANTELSGALRGGRTYYLVVEGYQQAAGPYTLTLETRYPGLSPAICEPGGAIAIELADAGSYPLSGNLYAAENLVSVYDCSPLAVRGGEAWYALHMAPAVPGGGESGYGSHVRVNVTASTSIQSLDLALWLFDGCGPDAACLAFADQRNAGGSETLTWQNLAPEPVTVYLAVDCLRAPNEELFGGYDLLFLATVAVERRSLTDVRNLFR